MNVPLPPPVAPPAVPPPPPAAPPGSLLTFDRVSKWFGDVVAVSDVSFALGEGVTALLGPNGAGKSTVLRLLCGLARPSEGRIRVLGKDPRADVDVLGKIGLVPQQEAMFEQLRPVEFVEAAARLLRVSDPAGAARDALGQVALAPDDPKPIQALSKGNRQRVKIAAALVHRPQILVLDEPLNGLDPRQRAHVIDLVRELGRLPGRCVVISSHVLDEVERFGSRILMIAQGRLAAEGDFRAIRDLMDDRPHRLRLVADQPARLAAGLLEARLVSGTRLGTASDGSAAVEIETTDVHGFRRGIAAVARERRVRLDEVVPLDDDLDSVFRYLVGR